MMTDIAAKPEKSENAFRTISEVADELGVQQHVLRFWETKFTSVKPMKRGGGRRYYRPEDVALIRKIHHLLYTEGYTIKGVQKLLKGVSKNAVLNEQRQSSNPAVKPTAPQPVQAHGSNLPQVKVASQVEAAESDKIILNEVQKAELQAVLAELKAMRALLDDETPQSSAA